MTTRSGVTLKTMQLIVPRIRFIANGPSAIARHPPRRQGQIVERHRDAGSNGENTGGRYIVPQRGARLQSRSVNDHIIGDDKLSGVQRYGLAGQTRCENNCGQTIHNIRHQGAQRTRAGISIVGHRHGQRRRWSRSRDIALEDVAGENRSRAVCEDRRAHGLAAAAIRAFTVTAPAAGRGIACERAIRDDRQPIERTDCAAQPCAAATAATAWREIKRSASAIAAESAREPANTRLGIIKIAAATATAPPKPPLPPL